MLLSTSHPLDINKICWSAPTALLSPTVNPNKNIVDSFCSRFSGKLSIWHDNSLLLPWSSSVGAC